MKAKKYWAVLMTAAMAGSLWACGDSGSSSGGETGGSTKDGEVALTYTTWNENQKDSIQDTID